MKKLTLSLLVAALVASFSSVTFAMVDPSGAGGTGSNMDMIQKVSDVEMEAMNPLQLMDDMDKSAIMRRKKSEIAKNMSMDFLSAISNPNNPLGEIFSNADFEAIKDFGGFLEGASRVSTSITMDPTGSTNYVNLTITASDQSIDGSIMNNRFGANQQELTVRLSVENLSSILAQTGRMTLLEALTLGVQKGDVTLLGAKVEDQSWPKQPIYNIQNQNK